MLMDNWEKSSIPSNAMDLWGHQGETLQDPSQSSILPKRCPQESMVDDSSQHL